MDSRYIKIINQILNYIHQHSDQDLSLEILAKIAGVSPFHFHRLFTILMNETLADYILRIRMEKAVKQIIYYPQKSFTEIAFDLGFSNSSSFSRAFKRYFGFTPRDAKSKKHPPSSKIGIIKSKYGKDLKVHELYPLLNVLTQEGECKMKVEIKKMPELKLVAVESNYTHESSMRAWEKLLNYYEENFQESIKKWDGLSKCFDDPAITSLEKCREENCLVVEETINLRSPFKSTNLPAGRYAVTNYQISDERPIEAIGEYIQKFYKEWLISSSYEADHYPLIQRYYLANEKPKKSSEKILDVQLESVDLMIKIKDHK